MKKKSSKAKPKRLPGAGSNAELSESAREHPKTMSKQTDKRTAEARADSLQRRVGHSYVFMRENHDWHGCEVSVISIEGKGFTVARCCDVCDGLLAPKGSRKRKLKTWTCTEDELW